MRTRIATALALAFGVAAVTAAPVAVASTGFVAETDLNGRDAPTLPSRRVGEASGSDKKV